MRTVRSLASIMICAALVTGCASFRPRPDENPTWQQRARMATDGGVTVRVAALTPDEARDALGFRLEGEGIQPVWVKVENGEPVRYYIPPIILDHEYYSPLEAAWKGHEWFSGETNARIDEHVRARRLPAFVELGASKEFTDQEAGCGTAEFRGSARPADPRKRAP